MYNINRKSSTAEALWRLYESYLALFNSTFVVKILHNQKDGYSTTVALYNNNNI